MGSFERSYQSRYTTRAGSIETRYTTDGRGTGTAQVTARVKVAKAPLTVNVPIEYA